MFINCPHCTALIATDPATDLPPPQCPRCAANLRPPADDAVPEAHAGSAPEADSAPSAADAGDRNGVPIATDVGGHDGVPGAPEGGDQDGVPGAAEAGDRHDMAAAMADGADAVEIAPRLLDAPAPGAIGDAADAIAPQPIGIAAIAPRRDQASPSFARARRADSVAATRRWPMPAATAALLLLLALQWILADRERLAADARWRPFVTGLCGVLRCNVPPWHEPSAFTLLDRDIRPHPTANGVLRVTATFRNDARWPQPWPRLQLSLSDVEGREVAGRTFDASEYLGATTTRNGLDNGQTASIRMDVREPGPGIVSFAFEFH